MKPTTPRDFLIAVLMVLAVTLIGATASRGNPGDLDPTFGNGGVVNTLFSPGSAVIATDVAIQSDGKILVVGTWWNVFQNPTRMVVARYNADGSLDTSFGNGGRVSTFFVLHSYGASIDVQPDGRIVIVGTITDNTSFDYVAARFESNGAPDSSFGVGGSVIVDMGGDDRVSSAAVQPDGRIVIVGNSSTETAERFGIARLDPSGTLDTLFDGDGKVLTPGLNGWATALALQQDNKIIVAGSVALNPENTYGDFAVVRYNADGSLDSTFDGDGIATTSVGSFGDGAAAVVVQPDGKILAAGSTFDEEDVFSYPTLVRYHTTGSLDDSFGTNGIAIPDLPGLFDSYSSVAIQSNGKIVAAGMTVTGLRRLPTVARHLASGSLDTSFGDDGIRTDQFGHDSSFTSIALGPGGGIVTAGLNVPAQFQEPNILLARYLGHDTSFDFDGDSRSDLSVFRPSDGVWYVNRSSAGFVATQFGLSSDMLTPADYDGDGATDIAVYRGGTWWMIQSSDSTVTAIQFGQAGDVPVPADYTGDGRDDIAVYRSGEWWSLDLTNGQSNLVRWGLATDNPVVADYDGDGRADPAVYRNGEWHIKRSSLGYTVIVFGLSSDRLVVGDYDGDGRADLGVYRDGTWYLQQSTDGFRAFQWGLPTDIPAPADYDGDGKADAAVFRNGEWYILRSAGGVSIQQFGLANDRPVAAAYLP